MLERRTKFLLGSAVLALAVLSAFGAIAYANRTLYNTQTDLMENDMWSTPDSSGNVTFGFGGCRGGMRGFGRGASPSAGMPIIVSEEYRSNVINITESDSDIQNLLAQNYTIVGVKPIIKATVEGDGTVTLKATTAIVTLAKNTTGRAIVWVDVEQAKVTRIEIFSVTVIDKSA